MDLELFIKEMAEGAEGFEKAVDMTSPDIDDLIMIQSVLITVSFGQFAKALQTEFKRLKELGDK